MNKAAHTTSLISRSKSSSGSNTSRQQWSNILHFISAKLVLRVEWNEPVQTSRDPLNKGKFSNLSPEILVQWIAPKNSALASQTMNLGSFYVFKQRNTAGSVWRWKTKDLKFVFRYLHFYLSYKRVLITYGNYSFKNYLHFYSSAECAYIVRQGYETCKDFRTPLLTGENCG